MVYLAREEDTDQAEIEWNFDFTTQDNSLNIADISLRFDTKIYEDGNINIRFLHKGIRIWSSQNRLIEKKIKFRFFRWNITEHREHSRS